MYGRLKWPAFAYARSVKELLRLQLAGSFRLLAEVVDSISDEEWTARPHPGANLLGYAPWHGARIIDWGVNHVLRDRVELADRPESKGVNVAGGLFGAGIARNVADRTATEVPRSLLKDYLTALRDDTLVWFDSLPADDLNLPVDLERGRARKPEYHAEAVWSEISDLDGLPAWQFIARPCISHIRVHYGAVMEQVELVRALNAAR